MGEYLAYEYTPQRSLHIVSSINRMLKTFICFLKQLLYEIACSLF